MGGTGLTKHLQYVYGLLEGRTARTVYSTVQVENGGRAAVELTNHDFPCPAWKIAIGSLGTSALAALKI